MPLVDRVLGLDYGERRIGVAISDGLGLTAQPHSVIDLAQMDLGKALAEIIAEYEIKRVVVGLPVSLSGSEGEVAARARAFAAEVADLTGLGVEMYDERFTSVEAERVLLDAGARRSRRKSVRDKLAASVMLQGYLDSAR
ncbi:MAG: Holliday junction resolvase RuvX [Acidimicrobiia bacterium]